MDTKKKIRETKDKLSELTELENDVKDSNRAIEAYRNQVIEMISLELGPNEKETIEVQKMINNDNIFKTFMIPSEYFQTPVSEKKQKEKPSKLILTLISIIVVLLSVLILLIIFSTGT